jgi:hypothetical protein
LKVKIVDNRLRDSLILAIEFAPCVVPFPIRGLCRPVGVQREPRGYDREDDSNSRSDQRPLHDAPSLLSLTLLRLLSIRERHLARGLCFGHIPQALRLGALPTDVLGLTRLDEIELQCGDLWRLR